MSKLSKATTSERTATETATDNLLPLLSVKEGYSHHTTRRRDTLVKLTVHFLRGINFQSNSLALWQCDHPRRAFIPGDIKATKRCLAFLIMQCVVAKDSPRSGCCAV